MVHIAVLLMVKNEKKRLNISLESVKDFADSLVIFDTGSTDNTIQICKDFSEKYNIPLRLKEGTFVDFSTSRNVSLEFADSFEDIDYILLMDTNDELRGGDNLRRFAEEYKENKSSGFLMVQEWWSGQHDKYYNVRFIKAHHKWRYHGVVHEYIKTELENEAPIVKLPDTAILYQDRTQDDDKSGKRFKRDKELLYNEYVKDPTEPRTVFYLAQTCSCMNDNEESLYYYKIRATLQGFQEERFHALLRSGELTQKLGQEWHDSMIYYIKAFEHSHRVEPLLYMAIHYIHIKMWVMAYTFLKLACSLHYPHDAILFVNRHDYDYKRWHLMGIVGYYIGQIADGKTACINAINYAKSSNSRINTDIDERNLKFYEEKEAEEMMQRGGIVPQYALNNPRQNQPNHQNQPNQQIMNEILTKKKFLEMKSAEILKENPKLNAKQVNSRANMEWKNSRKK
jgi:glycosyltransferase involved in cell wall biosynthesis